MNQPSTITSKKRARFCISVVLFSGILMLGLNFILPTVVVTPMMTLLGGDPGQNELLWLTFEITLYLGILLLTGAFLLIVFRKSPLSGFRGPLSTPKFPFLFIPATLGLTYVLNIFVQSVFQKPLEPFLPSVSEFSYPGTVVGVSLYCIMICILPAVFEEWLFRGIMQKNLAPAVGRTPAIVISALVFGFMHSNPAQTVFAFVLGLILGYAFYKTGSIWFGVLIHMVNNTISFGVSYWYTVYHIEWANIIASLFILLMIGVFVTAIPVYIVSAVHDRRKMARKTNEERLLPTGGTVLKMTVLNPLLYIMIAGYCLMLWITYFLVR